MPIYEYVCRTCGKRFEYMQPITQPALETCPAELCEQPTKGQGQVQRLLSRNVGFIFNGSGFYITDYVRKSSSSQSSASTAEGSNSSGSAGSQSDD
jgi:putative FmdB family regulatory protein